MKTPSRLSVFKHMLFQEFHDRFSRIMMSQPVTVRDFKWMNIWMASRVFCEQPMRSRLFRTSGAESNSIPNWIFVWSKNFPMIYLEKSSSWSEATLFKDEEKLVIFSFSVLREQPDVFSVNCTWHGLTFPGVECCKQASSKWSIFILNENQF